MSNEYVLFRSARAPDKTLVKMLHQMTVYKYGPPLFNLAMMLAQPNRLTNHTVFTIHKWMTQCSRQHTVHLNKEYSVNMFYSMFPLSQSFPVEGKPML